MKIAVQLYSVRTDASSDFGGALERVARAGYEGVEFAGLFGHSIAQVQKLLDKNSLIPVSAHLPIDGLLENPEHILNEYRELGCKYAVIPYLPDNMRYESGNFSKTLDSIRRLGDISSRLGLTLLYHNHNFEFCRVQDEYILDMLYRLVPAAQLKTQLDTCWISIAGEDPAKYINKYSGRCPVVHLKDYIRKTDSSGFCFCALGNGEMDFPVIISAAAAGGCEWLVVEQDEPDEGLTEQECVLRSRKYLHTIGY